jgi:hypothetical protein
VLGIVLSVMAMTASAGSARTAGGAPVPPKVKTGFGVWARSFHSSGPSGVTAAAQGATALGFCGGDDWEPEIAADPNSSYVYVVWAHFPGDPTCDPASGNPRAIYLRASADGGQSFGPVTLLPLPPGLPYPNIVDCVVTVDAATGTVYVSFLGWGLKANKTDVLVARSTDHGATFTSVKVNSPVCSNCDHPWTAAFNDNVYTAYAQGKNHFLSRSADGGRTWTETDVLDADAVAFPEGAVVDPAGNVYFAWGDCKTSSCNGNTAGNYRVSKTLAGTSTTAFTLVASGPAGPACPYAPNCGFAFFGIQDDIAIDAAGTLYLVWQDGQDHTKAGSPPIVQLSRSTDGGATWTYVRRVDDKNASGCAGSACYALFPRVEGSAAGHIDVMWMDDRKGSPIDHVNGWNVWLRSSTNGGSSWGGASTRVSTFDPNRPQSRRNGFLFPYGDYQGIDVTPTGQAVMIWGEGINWVGGPSNPGAVVYRSLPA